MKELTLLKLAQVIEGKLYPERDGDQIVTGVSIDSRRIKPGDIFFAIKGLKFDGSSFITDAVRNGASCVILDSFPSIEINAPFIIVDNVVDSLGRLARFLRDILPAKLIGITGSLGKSTTKELVGRVLKGKYRTVVAEKSFNNFIGLPLTILRAISDTEYIVEELGINHKDEMDSLLEIAKPDYGMITGIAPVHTEGLGNIDEIDKEKLKLLYSLPPGSKAFLNGDDPYLTNLSQVPYCSVIYYGKSQNCDIRGEIISSSWDGLDFKIDGNEFKLPLIGRFWIYSALATFAIARSFGIDIQTIADIFSSFQGLPGRMEVKKVGGVIIIDDSYNANPTSVSRVLSTISELPSKRKFVFLGDMLELGYQSSNAHRKIGKEIVDYGFNFAAFLGENTSVAYQEAKQAGLGFGNHFLGMEEVLDEIEKMEFLEGDVILVKGSRAMQMEKIVHKILEVL